MARASRLDGVSTYFDPAARGPGRTTKSTWLPWRREDVSTPASSSKRVNTSLRARGEMVKRVWPGLFLVRCATFSPVASHRP